ncbi:hypothetical protein SLEP1_g3780 [Rubroshorea leprosula]|uniref:Uncharacterized protein n=1 Tax=Rubroshorea leprosula TaxID=152421 RepID=A0AAV5HVF1_9ROSI|nr:hypothetical protein SLEP1_g3780 [Rubroshorea leprosula]
MNHRNSINAGASIGSHQKIALLLHLHDFTEDQVLVLEFLQAGHFVDD